MGLFESTAITRTEAALMRRIELSDDEIDALISAIYALRQYDADAELRVALDSACKKLETARALKQRTITLEPEEWLDQFKH